MSYLSNDEYDRISKNAKNCLGSVRELSDKYNKLRRDHEEFNKLARDSGLSTLANLIELEKKQFRCIKYMEELDKTFIRGPTAALIESGKSNFYDNPVAKITSTTVEPNMSRAKAGMVLCLNEAICADLSASSNAILSSKNKFREEMGEACKADFNKVDDLIAIINEIQIDF
ncbi:hypothetical protein ACTXT7_006970 [Hymenolepis weldensis]